VAEFSKLVINQKGLALIAKVLAGTANDVDFTKIAASDAKYTVDELEGLDSLSGIMQEAEVSRKTRTNEVAVKVEAAFTNTELAVGYHMRALGLYALDPDEGEILYAIAVETSGSCYMPPYNGITVSGAYIQLVTTVGNADHVNLEVTPAAIATIGDIQDLREQIQEALSNLSIGPTIVEAFIMGGKQAWVESDAPTGYYYQDVPVEGCREWHRARVIIKKVLDMPYVRAMEILPTVETMDGCIRVWGRKQIGAKSIAISVELYSEGAGSGTGTGYTLPVASADRLGGVKVGSGVGVEEDGTISVDAAGALGEAIATPDEVNAALDQAFEEKGGGEDGRQL